METLGNAAKICLLLSILSYFPSLSEGIEATWTSSSSVNGLEGQSVNMTWAIDFVNYPSGTKWLFVKISQDPSKEVISYTNDGRKTVFGDFQSREADLTLYASQNGTIVTVVFTMANLNKTTDQNGYRASVTNLYPDTKTVATSTMLTVLVPIAIASPNPQTVTVNETQTAQLLCAATGNPPPSFNWTRNGVTVSTESPSYTTPATTFNDDKTCYTCVAYNGFLEAKTANVCLNVQYKPRNATVSSNKAMVCQNYKVNLTCISGPGNPASSSYEFYNNGVLVGTSASNVYEATATAGLPDVNKFVCVPRNLLGGSLENGSVEVNAKVTPTVTQTLGTTKTVVEGSNLTLACNASATTPLNVTWTRTGSPDVVGLEYPIMDIRRGDAGLYSCTVNNGAECPSNTAIINVTVNYKPESTNLTYAPNNDNFCKGNRINLTCAANANPVAIYSLYRNSQLVQDESTTGVFSNVQLNEKGDKTFTCVPNNTAGTGENKSIQIFVKEAPVITTSPQPKTVVEGQSLTLFCNATGLPVPNITWTKVGGSTVGSGETFTIASLVRGDEGSYRCTASNGNECSSVTADALVIVNYPPRNTTISTNKSDNTFLKGDNVKLSCASLSKPQLCNVTFYHGNNIISSYYGNTCAGAEAASHVITSINGCNLEEYSCKVENQYGQEESKINLTVKVSSTISTSPAADIVLVKGDSLDLNCTATGCPTPNITWTKTGVSAALVSDTGFFISRRFISLSKTDTGSYKCSVDNGVVGSPMERTIHVNVTYKPYLTNLTSTLSNACVNDTVSLECTTDANPPVHEYRFYLNEGFVYTSSSGVYQFNVPQAGNNTYKCEPVNTVGTGQNATVTIPTKAPPQITYVSPNQTVVEGTNVVLSCNVTGSDPLNVTWSKDGVSSYPEGSSPTFASIRRGDEATFQCTAHNGNECPAATATSSVTVIYMPENTNLTVNKSSNVFLLEEPVTLNCQSAAKPSACNVVFYYGDQLLANKSSSTCSSSYLISGIQGCNEESFSCIAFNDAGMGERVYQNVTVQAPPGASITPSSDTIAKEEGHPLFLNCTPTGCPSANVTWTKNGVSSSLVQGNGNTLVKSFTSLTKQDTGSYQCTVDNGVAGSPVSKTIYVNVTYKPFLTNLTSTLSNACVNDTVSLECTTDANPPVHEYRFYLNEGLVYTSNSGVYQFNIPQAGNNTYMCEPVNSLGSGQNATVIIGSKAPAQITSITPNQTVVEGKNVVLMCNVTGSNPLNVTWSKVGGSSYPERSSHTLASIRRGDEATYQCTAHNGKECSSATARSSIAVIYKPENTNLTASNSSACLDDELTLTCNTHAKPPATTYKFYRNGQLFHETSNTGIYTFTLAVNGTNVYMCQPGNKAGNDTTSNPNVTVVVKAAPVITYATPSQQVIEGSIIELVCNVIDHSGHLNVSWHKIGGGQLSSNSTYTLSPVNRNDTGSYECRAHNGNECDAKSRTTNITVTYPAIISYYSSVNGMIHENDVVTLTCRVAGVPNPTVNWTRNGQLIDVHGETYRFNAREPLSANYSCVVFNGIGEVKRRTFNVNIKGHCKGHRCRYGSTCRSEGQDYRCLCTRGLTGKYCEIEDPVHTVFIVLLVIEDPVWDEEYENKKSAKFEDLETMICTMMFKIYNGNPPAILGKSLVVCTLISASRGSIYTNTELTFNDSLVQSEVLGTIKGATINETIFGNLTLKKSGLEVHPRTNPCSSEPCKFDSKCIVRDQGYRCDCTAFRYGQHCEKGLGLIPGIIIIIACIMILIIAIILCCLYCKRRKAHTYPSGSAEENGTQMQAYQVADHKSSASNPYVSTQDENPAVKNGQPSEIYRQNGKEDVTYAALCFKAFGDPENKEKVEKFPEKSDTVYAEIVSFQQNIDKEKTEMKGALDEEAIELTETDQDKPDGDIDIKIEEGQENQAINETATTPDEEGGGNDTFENQQTNVDSSSPLQNIV